MPKIDFIPNDFAESFYDGVVCHVKKTSKWVLLRGES
jgi:hypothetical protein